MKSAVQIWPISNSIIVVIYFKYNKILVSTKTLPTSNKELRIVTVVTVQFYRLGAVSRYRDSFEWEIPEGSGLDPCSFWSNLAFRPEGQGHFGQKVQILSGQKLGSENSGIKQLCQWGLSRGSKLASLYEQTVEVCS